MELTKKGNETRQRIIDTAVRLFARKGYATVGLRELAREADVNLAMINYFFGSKKGLLKEILDTMFSGYIAIARQHLVGPETPEKKIRRFIHHAIDYFSENRNCLIILLTELPHEDPDIIEYKAEWVKKLVPLIQEEICVPLKTFHGISISPVVMGPLMLSMMSSRFLFAPMIETVNPPGLKEEFLDRYPDLVADIFLNGLNGLSTQKGRERE